MEQAASNDEIVGMVLGLFYLYRASKDADPSLSRRVEQLVRRLASRLKANAYLILPPADLCIRHRNEIHRGFSGLAVSFQWALERAFVSITGESFHPSNTDYRAAAARTLDILTAEIEHNADFDSSRYAAPLEILSVLYLWQLQGRIAEEDRGRLAELAVVSGFGDDEFIAALATISFGVQVGIGGPMFHGFRHIVGETMEEIATAFRASYVRYRFSIVFLKWATYAGFDANWFNFALLRHTLLFSLDGQGEDAQVAGDARELLRVVLTGERAFWVVLLQFLEEIKSGWSYADVAWLFVTGGGYIAIMCERVFAEAGIDARAEIPELIEDMVATVTVDTIEDLYELYEELASIRSITDIDLIALWEKVRNLGSLDEFKDLWREYVGKFEAWIRQAEDKIRELMEENEDDDFYAAVIAKGLLGGLSDESYARRVEEALERRARMCPEQPVGELCNVRTPPGLPWQDQCKPSVWPEHGLDDWNLAPVPYHNTALLSDPKALVGTDFCWENVKGRERVLGSTSHKKTYYTSTGVEACSILEVLKLGRDVMLEGGGLDFLFPRALMSLWWNEPLEFQDKAFPPLQALSCLPFQAREGEFREARCSPPRSDDWLLMSSSIG